MGWGDSTLIPNVNTLGYWKMNGNSNDSSGNSLNGTDTSMTYGLAYGKFNQGGSFSGSGYISVPNSSVIKPTGNFTQSCWIKTTQSTDYGSIFGHFELTGANYTGWRTDFYGVDGNLQFYVGVNTPSYSYVLGTKPINDGKWHNLVFLYNGSYIQIYIDGKYNNQTAFSAGVNYTNTTTPRIGVLTYSGGTIQYLTGNLEEVIIENIAWSAQQIRQYYSSCLGFFQINN